MRLSKAIEEWVKDMEASRKSPNTVRGYEHDVKSLLKVCDRDSVTEFTPALVKKVFEKVDGRLRQSSLYRYQSSLSSFAKWGMARTRRYWVDNPMEDHARIRMPDSVPKPFDRDQMMRLLALELPVIEDLTRAILTFTGLRVTAISRLNVGDVTFDPPKIRAYEKGGRTRVVDIHPILADKLTAYLVTRGQPHPAAPLLMFQNRMRVGARTIQRWARAWGDACDPKVMNCTPHRFRHMFGTTLLEQTSDLRLVQEAMGHRSIRSTEIYTRVHSERVKAAINGLPWS